MQQKSWLYGFCSSVIVHLCFPVKHSLKINTWIHSECMTFTEGSLQEGMWTLVRGEPATKHTVKIIFITHDDEKT
jgi:hypothetical protein